MTRQEFEEKYRREALDILSKLSPRDLASLAIIMDSYPSYSGVNSLGDEDKRRILADSILSRHSELLGERERLYRIEGALEIMRGH